MRNIDKAIITAFSGTVLVIAALLGVQHLLGFRMDHFTKQIMFAEAVVTVTFSFCFYPLEPRQ